MNPAAEQAAAAFVSRLEALGWFASLPASAIVAVRSAVAEAVAAGRPLYSGLVSVVVDDAYLREDQAWSALLRQFTAASLGALDLEPAGEERHEDGVRLRYRANGREHVLELPDEVEDAPPAFYAAVNGGLRDAGSPLRFRSLKEMPWGPLPSFVLTTPDAFERAAAEGLLSPRVATDEDFERFAELAEKIMLGEEIFYWVIDRKTLGELKVPRRSRVQQQDGRAQGAGVETILSYEKSGDIILRCAGEAGAAPALPADFVQEEERGEADRVVRTGRCRFEGRAMRWRFDSLTAAPVHVGSVVVERSAESFFEAVASFRLHETTPEIRAVIDSCGQPASD